MITDVRPVSAVRDRLGGQFASVEASRNEVET